MTQQPCHQKQWKLRDKRAIQNTGLEEVQDYSNILKTYDPLLQVEKQNCEVEIKKSIIFLNSSPEAIVHVAETLLLTSKTKQKIALDHSPEVYGNWVRPKIRPE